MDLLTNGRSMISRLAFSMVVWMACAALGRGQPINQIGDKGSAWPTTWNVLSGLNEEQTLAPLYGLLDFVGSSTYPGAYWAQDSGYIYFRMRVNVGTVDATTYDGRGTLNVFIDTNNNRVPDYGFSWDAFSSNDAIHGLEMTVPNTDGEKWNMLNIVDLDGSHSLKGDKDINGSSRTTDGYVRSVDGQASAGLGGGTTSFIDFAVSWNYLASYTPLRPGQTWRIALASGTLTDKDNSARSDIAGGATPASDFTEGWSSTFDTQEVPEPSSLVVLGVVVLSGYVSCRLRHKKQDPEGTADASRTAS